MGSNNEGTKFYVKDCALSGIAVGEHAANLKELYDKLVTIHPGCIYHHFWGGRLRPHFEAREYHNDFAMWAYAHLHDQTLAERLSLLDPTDFEDIENLRKAVLDIIETHLDETEGSWLPRAEHFQFVRSKIIIFDTPYIVSTPEELIQNFPHLTLSSIFYHFIDAYRRTPTHQDDFSAWLKTFPENYDVLIEHILAIDFYFISLEELKNTLYSLLTNYFMQSEKK